MVFFTVNTPQFTTQTFLEALAARGVRMEVLGHGRIRAVIHFEHGDEDIQQTISVFQDLLAPTSIPVS